MELIVNGSERDFPGVAMLDQLIERLDLLDSPAGIAVAVNNTVVPREEWSGLRLERGDAIEVIHAVQGG
ncbi:MAG: sulfur carrier protein ThiS [Candidatus Krumholzibacteriia bacterium]